MALRQEATMEEMGLLNRTSADDDKLVVHFTMEPKEDQDATAREGRPIFKEVPFVMIMVPGDKDSIIHREAGELDTARFPRQFAAFKNKQDQNAVSGTPLSAAPWLQRTQVRELEYFNCYTVEQLASMSDTNASKFAGINQLREMARTMVAAAKEQAPLHKMAADLKVRDDLIADLTARLTKLETPKAAVPEKAK